MTNHAPLEQGKRWPVRPPSIEEVEEADREAREKAVEDQRFDQGFAEYERDREEVHGG